MFCSKCGSEIEDNSQFCPKCGEKMKTGRLDTEILSERKRHGFTTFWLVFGIISCSITGGIYLFNPYFILNLYPKATNGIVMLLGLLTAVDIVLYVLLLCWKKIGFWLFVGVSILSIFLNISIGLNIVQSIFGLVGIAILYGVLHIRKNGKTTWEQLL